MTARASGTRQSGDWSTGIGDPRAPWSRACKEFSTLRIDSPVQRDQRRLEKNNNQSAPASPTMHGVSFERRIFLKTQVFSCDPCSLKSHHARQSSRFSRHNRLYATMFFTRAVIPSTGRKHGSRPVDFTSLICGEKLRLDATEVRTRGRGSTRGGPQRERVL